MAASLTYTEGRYRCDECGKVAYQVEEAAVTAALKISQREPMRPYFSEKCGWWHVSRKDAQNWLLTQKNAFELRDYQGAAIDAIYTYFSEEMGCPVLALPTGTGKSVIIAEFIRSAVWQYRDTRILNLTHVKELIEQNLNTLLAMWPSAPAGVFSAGLGRREISQVTFAGIQSVHNYAEAFGHIDLVIIDECHLVSPNNSTMYRKFIEALKVINPKVKVIGFSATPYRLGQGMLTDSEQGLFTHVAFDMTSREAFNWMIAQGWIVPLIPKKTDSLLDLAGVRMQGGEFVLSDLQDHVDKEEVTFEALKETVNQAHNRQSWLVFASGITHAENVADMLNTHFEIEASFIHSKIPDADRNQRIADFKSGKLRALVNNNILTTGFDFAGIDCIVMLRPTASPVLWVQMLGRGTRPIYAPGFDLSTPEGRRAAIQASLKPNCLVLDFARNTERLGPINDPVIPHKKGRGAKGIAPVKVCEQCGFYSHASCRYCENPLCGAEFPKTVKISSEASEQALIIGDILPINKYPVTKVIYKVHQKKDKPPSMRVDYWCGMRRFSEFVCLDHGGYAARVARQWWNYRSPWGAPPSVQDGMLAINYLPVPKTISVIEKGKYPEITGYEF